MNQIASSERPKSAAATTPEGKNRRQLGDEPGFARRNRRPLWNMIGNDQELSVTLERIAKLQRQVAHLPNVETNPQDYHRSASGFLAEIDRMQLEVREYLSLHPAELAKGDA